MSESDVYTEDFLQGISVWKMVMVAKMLIMYSGKRGAVDRLTASPYPDMIDNREQDITINKAESILKINKSSGFNPL